MALDDDPLDDVIARWTGLYAATDEKHDPERFAGDVPADKQVTARGIEIGHIFFFGSKYSRPLECVVQGPDGEQILLRDYSV